MNKSPKVVTKTYKYGGLTVEDMFPSHSVIDDKLYIDLSIWQTLPRGCAIVKNDQGDVVARLHGTPKFGDSSDKFGHMDLDWDTVYATVKENGECFHVTFFTHEAKVYCLIGSKNVHILVVIGRVAPSDAEDRTALSVEEQLSKIAQEQPERTKYAIKMARAFFKECYSPELAQMICETGMTLCGEYINPEHKHIVEYSSEQIKFFAVTHPDRPNGWYTVYTPEEAVDLWKRYNLKHVEYIVCKTQAELEHVQQEYFNKENSEGLVLYYCRDNIVINMHKYKNKQYTVLRTIREMYNSESSVLRLEDRLNEYHLELTQAEIKTFVNFFKWCKHQSKDREAYNIKWWNDFCEQGQPVVDNSHKAVIMFVGVPGVGKTTIGSTLVFTMLSENIQSRYIDQDFCGGNPKTLANTFNKMLCDPGVEVIVHCKSNTTRKMREQTLAGITSERLWVVSLEHTQDVVQRAVNRKYHPNLSGERAVSVVKNFIASYEPPLEEEFIKYDNFMELISVSYGGTIQEIVTKLYNECVSNMSPMIIPFSWSNYIGICLPESEMHQVFSTCTGFPSEQFGVKANFHGVHITLIHSSSYILNYKLAAGLYSKVQSRVQVRITGLCWNEEMSAFSVELPDGIGCTNTHPHVSWRKRDRHVENYSSNAMLAGEHNKIPLDITIEGVICEF